MNYEKFLESKARQFSSCGFDPPELNPQLFPFQNDIVRWAIRKGRAAIFADCGMGKTFMQLEWASHVAAHTGKPVIVFSPLSVSIQSQAEGERFGISIQIVKDSGEISEPLAITNYEKLAKFSDSSVYGGVVLDESSILKAIDGKTRKALTEWAKDIPYRLACSATPSPNDHMELGMHSEFLGIMTHVEMLATFFVHDGGDTSKWRLKGHAKQKFWKWVCSWAVAIRKPSDIGYEDGDFILPELRMHQITVASGPPEGSLFATEARTLQERRAARREGLEARVAACANLINGSDDQWLVWCNLNDESKSLTAAIDGAVEVTGSDKDEHKETSAKRFADGEIGKLVSKPVIFGYGMNFQSCHKVAFVGLSDSYEQFYQAIRRCWRFGQKHPVDCYVITSEAEGAVVENIQRKEKQAAEMMESMVREMREEMNKELHGHVEKTTGVERLEESSEDWRMVRNDCVAEVAKIPSDSIHYSIFSPPFASLYTYTASELDMGNCSNADEFQEHFRFLVAELHRVLMPGRLVSFHCMNLPISKQAEGYIGVRDFRGDLIRAFIGDEGKTMADAIRILGIRAKMAEIDGDVKRQISLEDAARAIAEEMDTHKGPGGFIYHSEVCIWKDPVTAMQRTKALGLLHKQIVKDSAMSRQGIADYLVTMRKPGQNPEPVKGKLKRYVGEDGTGPSQTDDETRYSIEVWQRYASPVWMDINPSDTLQHRSAREDADERHICPLQLQVIERGIELWSNPGDVVLSPFAGIGSEGFVAMRAGRKFIGVELKESYYKQAVANLKSSETPSNLSIFPE